MTDEDKTATMQSKNKENGFGRSKTQSSTLAASGLGSTSPYWKSPAPRDHCLSVLEITRNILPTVPTASGLHTWDWMAAAVEIASDAAAKAMTATMIVAAMPVPVAEPAAATSTATVPGATAAVTATASPMPAEKAVEGMALAETAAVAAAAVAAAALSPPSQHTPSRSLCRMWAQMVLWKKAGQSPGMGQDFQY